MTETYIGCNSSTSLTTVLIIILNSVILVTSVIRLSTISDLDCKIPAGTCSSVWLKAVIDVIFTGEVELKLVTVITWI